MRRRVVITGIGVVTPIGIGREAFWGALLEGRPGIEAASLFDASAFKSRTAAEVKGFNASQLLGRKGLQYLSRSMSLACVAAKLSMEDAGIEVTEENRSRIGVSYGTTLSGLTGEAKFDQLSLTEGPLYVNPMSFPSTGPSASACQVSITFGVEAFNATHTNGQTSSLDAINYGVNFIRMGRADVVLAGGVEEVCLEAFLGYYLSGALSGSDNGGREICAPFDRRRNGITLGEGSAVLLLEDYEHARRRGANLYAQIGGYGTAFEPLEANGYDPEARGAAGAMRAALKDSGLEPSAVELICANANSSPTADAMEARAIRDVFGAGREPLVTAVKSMLGECCGAAGAMQASAAALALREGIVPPTINYSEPDPECPLSALVTSAVRANPRNALINSFGWSGNNASLILTRPGG